MNRNNAVGIGGAGAAGCLVGTFALCCWALGIVFAILLNVAWISALIAGVYFLFTGEWIGNAPFLN